MASTHIELTKDELLAQAKRVAELREEYDTLTTQLGGIIKGLGGGAWKGLSQQAMENRYEEMRPLFQRFSEQLEQYYTDMNKVAEEMSAEDTSIAQKIRSRTFG